ncbi:MAG: hypothetical protein JO051_04655 [Acidobacteriaceae bacterium]|nr:hypothetical protein [Acidobacteriaceae bacterium]
MAVVSCYGDLMHEAALLDELLDPLARCLDLESAQRVAESKISPAVQQKADALAQRANEGMLTAAEHSEYEALINAADLIAVLKVKARRLTSKRRS